MPATTIWISWRLFQIHGDGGRENFSGSKHFQHHRFLIKGGALQIGPGKHKLVEGMEHMTVQDTPEKVI